MIWVRLLTAMTGGCHVAIPNPRNWAVRRVAVTRRAGDRPGDRHPGGHPPPLPHSSLSAHRHVVAGPEAAAADPTQLLQEEALDTARVWFITGASRGFGRLFTQTALACGDRVVATLRQPDLLDDLRARSNGRLHTLALDVRDREAVFAAVAAAIEMAGRLDIVINNAGYVLAGAVEEITEDAARQIMDTNFFGTLWVCQAAAPYLRAQRSGHIIQMSSIAGLTGIPTQGLYAAGKFAVEGMTESLAGELEPFGVRLTLIEPGAHATGPMGPTVTFADFTDAYQPVRDALMERFADAKFGDPARVAEAVLTVVNSANPPRRLLLGSEFDMIVSLHRSRLEEWAAWKQAGSAAAG